VSGSSGSDNRAAGTVFNPLTPAQVVAAIGTTAREIARSDVELSDYARGQLLSAYSSSRHITVEIDRYDDEIRAFASDVGEWTLAAAGRLTVPEAAIAIGSELEGTSNARDTGDLVSDLLEHLRSDSSAAATQLRAQIRSRLRRLAEREVELLADVIEGGAGQR
jgi:hypothetical protein